MSKAYLQGALHDATERDYTYRLSQKSEIYITRIVELVRRLGGKAWMYREGQDRDMYIAEFSKRIVADVSYSSPEAKADYIRGYFDADGSVPADSNARPYIYFAQNDKADLIEVKEFLATLGIESGMLHQPSKQVRPKYWRFYVSTNSHQKFCERIGSWHPRKRERLQQIVSAAAQ